MFWAFIYIINGILKQEFSLYKCQNLKELKQLVDESILIYNEMSEAFEFRDENTEPSAQKRPEAKATGLSLKPSTYLRTGDNILY